MVEIHNKQECEGDQQPISQMYNVHIDENLLQRQ